MKEKKHGNSSGIKVLFWSWLWSEAEKTTSKQSIQAHCEAAIRGTEVNRARKELVVNQTVLKYSNSSGY